MKKALLLLKKFKKGFTLMECVCAIAVVGLLSAIILPLTAASIKSMRVSDALRTAAQDASSKNASVTTNKNDKSTSESIYVTVNYKDVPGVSHVESAFVFTKTNSTNNDYKVSVTYYDLKYGKETEDIKN